jgi:hypothetical protein
MANTDNENHSIPTMFDVISLEAVSSPMTSTTSSEKVLEVIEAGSFNRLRSKVSDKMDMLLAETFDDLTVSSKSDCHNLITFTQSRDTAKTYTSEFESEKRVAKTVPWYEKNGVLVLDECINVIVDASYLAKTDDFDKSISKTIEKIVQTPSPEKRTDEVFPNFNIPLLSTIIPLPIPDDVRKKLCFAEMLLVCLQDSLDFEE